MEGTEHGTTVQRGDRAYGRDECQGRHTLGQERSDRGSIGTAAGDAEHGEAIDGKHIRDAHDVGHERRQRRIGMSRRLAIAPAIRCDHAQPEPAGGLRRRVHQPRRGRPVQRNHRQASRIAVLAHRHQPAVATRNGAVARRAAEIDRHGVSSDLPRKRVPAMGLPL